MRALRLLLTAALLAGSIPADAQVRALRPVGGGNAAAAVRLSVPSLGAAASLALPSLAPSLPAPSEAPKPGEAFRAEAAQTIAQWRAARAAAPASTPSPAPLVAAEASSPKAALTAEQTAAAATDAIIAAKGVDEALGSLVSLGVLKAQALPEGETDRLALLKRVWDGVSGKRAAELLPVDAGWAVPALRVERGGKTYLVHGVAHGQYYPAHRRSVMRLVKQVSAQGSVLLSEQRIPEHYGFSYGLETLDHAVVSHDERAEVVKAARGLPPAAIGAVHALMRLGALGGVGYAWARAALQGADPLAWGLALAGGAALYLLWRGMQPLNRLSVLAGAREADSLGSPHLAEQLRREAKAFFTKPVRAEDVRALHLPPGPAASTDEFSPRSAAIAAAARAAEGSVVHVLVGYKHAAEIAWRLAGYPAGAGAAPRKEDAGNGGAVRSLGALAASLAGSKPKLPRDLTMTELFVLNLAGMAAAVGIGMLLESWLVGLLGLYLVPVPFIIGYVLVRRVMGDAVKMPLIRYDPGISWAGKRYPYGDDDRGARR